MCSHSTLAKTLGYATLKPRDEIVLIDRATAELRGAGSATFPPTHLLRRKQALGTGNASDLAGHRDTSAVDKEDT